MEINVGIVRYYILSIKINSFTFTDASILNLEKQEVVSDTWFSTVRSESKQTLLSMSAPRGHD